jgi:hypothetical protein
VVVTFVTYFYAALAPDVAQKHVAGKEILKTIMAP